MPARFAGWLLIYFKMIEDRRAIDLTEQFADGEVSRDALATAMDPPYPFAPSFPETPTGYVLYAISYLALPGAEEFSGGTVQLIHALKYVGIDEVALLPFFHDVFGNPFRPASVAGSWLTLSVQKLAATIYADRAFHRLPILADALEEAGCDDADILGHCRGPGPHVRGCWVVDFLLGKS